MRILTLNLHRTGPDWEARRAVLIDGIRAASPDLVAFQESMVIEGYEQAADILGEGYEVIEQHRRRADGTGIALASRWPILRTHEVDLRVTPRTVEYEVGALFAEIGAPAANGPLVFVNAFPSWEPNFELEREQQAVALAREIERFAAEGSHVILAGDLDADPRAASIRFWTGRQSLDGMSTCYRDAWESANPGHEGADAATFTPDNPSVLVDWPFRRIDYILVRCGHQGGPTLQIQGCARIFDSAVDDVWASDHFGLVADLEPPD